MLIETFVLGGQNSLFHDIRDLADADDGTPFLTEFAQQLALGGDDAQWNFRLVIRQCGERGKRGPQQCENERAEKRADQAQAEQHRSDVQQPTL